MDEHTTKKWAGSVRTTPHDARHWHGSLKAVDGAPALARELEGFKALNDLNDLNELNLHSCMEE